MVLVSLETHSVFILLIAKIVIIQKKTQPSNHKSLPHFPFIPSRHMSINHTTFAFGMLPSHNGEVNVARYQKPINTLLMNIKAPANNLITIPSKFPLKAIPSSFILSQTPDVSSCNPLTFFLWRHSGYNPKCSAERGRWWRRRNTWKYRISISRWHVEETASSVQCLWSEGESKQNGCAPANEHIFKVRLVCSI